MNLHDNDLVFVRTESCLALGNEPDDFTWVCLCVCVLLWCDGRKTYHTRLVFPLPLPHRPITKLCTLHSPEYPKSRGNKSKQHKRVFIIFFFYDW